MMGYEILSDKPFFFLRREIRGGKGNVKWKTLGSKPNFTGKYWVRTKPFTYKEVWFDENGWSKKSGEFKYWLDDEVNYSPDRMTLKPSWADVSYDEYCIRKAL
jgi:hypothetical protein